LGLLGLIVSYALGYNSVFLLLPRLGATQTALVLNIDPVAVAIGAWVALDEALSPSQVVGGSMVVLAVIFYQAYGRRQ
jgi:drug/metabolite transporter (DMT)-like permease